MSDVGMHELMDLKRKLKALLPKLPYKGGEKVIRPRPYVPEKKDERFPDWWGQETGKHPMLPLKPPGR